MAVLLIVMYIGKAFIEGLAPHRSASEGINEKLLRELLEEIRMLRREIEELKEELRE